METKIRVVAAVIHEATNEVEIIVEKVVPVSFLNDTTTLYSIWIDCEKELNNLLEGEI